MYMLCLRLCYVTLSDTCFTLYQCVLVQNNSVNYNLCVHLDHYTKFVNSLCSMICGTHAHYIFTLEHTTWYDSTTFYPVYIDVCSYNMLYNTNQFVIHLSISRTAVISINWNYYLCKLSIAKIYQLTVTVIYNTYNTAIYHSPKTQYSQILQKITY